MNYNYIPLWLQGVISRRVSNDNYPWDPRGVSPDHVAANFLFDRSAQFSLSFLQRLSMFVQEWGTMQGICIRVLEPLAALEASVQSEAEAAASSPADDTIKIDDGIRLRDLDFVTNEG